MKKQINNKITICEEATHNMLESLKLLSGLEHKIFVFLANKAVNDDGENREFVFDIRDFWERRDRGLNGKNYQEFRECVYNISKLGYKITVNGFKIDGHWFSRVGFYESGTEGVIKFDDYSYAFMQEYIADGGNCDRLMDMTSKYGIRLYDCLKSHVGKRDFAFPLAQLRVDMGVSGDKYPEYRDFKRNVMAPAIFEVNNHTDFLVSFKEKRTNRYVSHLLFTVLKKQPPVE